jgi:hypothetical protein
MTRPGPLYFDSDCLILFAGAGLIPQLLAAVGREVASARRLGPLPEMLRGGRLSRAYPLSLRQRAEAWCSAVAAIDRAPDAAMLDRLLAIEGIDPGEAMLFALTAGAEGAIVTTGDKRACAALAAAVPSLERALGGKILCLEPALGLVLETVGFATLAPALAQVREHNATLRVLLPQGEATPGDTFRTGLDSYLRDVRSRLGGLLYSATHGRRPER